MIKTILLWPVLLCSLAVSFVNTISADSLLLKDGTLVEAERVWTSDAFVHFILKGTQNVEIRYAKEIVDQINGKPLSREIQQEIAEETPAAAGREQDPNPFRKALPEKQPTAQKPGPSAAEIERLVDASRGIHFYDPRRAKRYQSDPKTGHANLNGALSHLAERYGRSIEWVETHIGEENDLAKIHRNLGAALNAGNTTGAEKKQQKSDENPDENEKNEPEKRTVSSGQGGKPQNAVLAAEQPVVPRSYHGVQFYDPRRKKRYWSTPSNKHHTLDQAIRALALQYGVSAQWIEKHMGESNQLDRIHQAIRDHIGQSP